MRKREIGKRRKRQKDGKKKSANHANTKVARGGKGISVGGGILQMNHGAVLQKLSI